jgi:hypothetical protein
MPTMENTTHDVVQEAKAEFTRSTDRLTKALESTPDDKINWSPSPTSRTPVHQVAHAAMAIGGMQGMLQGKPFPFKDTADMDTTIRAEEKAFTTREQALELLETNKNAYLAYLDALTPEQLASNFDSPMGSFPMTAAITFIADHNRSHASQIDYMQTIYGDMEWHY